MRYFLLLIFLTEITANENRSFEVNVENESISKNYKNKQIKKDILWEEWSPCSRTCGGGISSQPKRCHRKSCKIKPLNNIYKVCNRQPCDTPFDFRSQQCSEYDAIPYNDKLLKWYPYYDSSQPCALICQGKPKNEPMRTLKQEFFTNEEEPEVEDSIIVRFADKVEDGTKCYPESNDICINGKCMRVGCDMKVGSNKNKDICGICGGDGSTCKYAWTFESTSACSKSCGGGFQIATSICKPVANQESIVDDTKCGLKIKPDNIHLPCNTHSCTAKWLTGEWSECSASCGGGFKNRAVFCIEENGNATNKLPDYKCNINHKPNYEEICNTVSCPTWKTGEWNKCSLTCGSGLKRRSVECRNGDGELSTDCNLLEKPRTEQKCKTRIKSDCSNFELTKSLVRSYPLYPVPEKLIDQSVPSQPTFIPDEWSMCSVTCGEGIRHREVHCKIFLDFVRGIANLPNDHCFGTLPIQTEKCIMQPCNITENTFEYKVDAVRDSGYAESSLTTSFESSLVAASNGANTGGGYENLVKVAPGSTVKTTYSWKELGYTDCSATCLGGVQDLIITCVRDDTGKTVMPLLCTAETKPESRIRVCNDHPCPPRWNMSEFSTCMSPCGLGIQTREVNCIHEVTRGTGNTVAVPNHMCPQPSPVDRQYCNVWDCPVEWHIDEWSKCSKTCGGGIKKRKISCEQVMAQGRKQSRTENDCPSPKPRSLKECNTRPCNQINTNIQPIITTKNITYIQNKSENKVNLDIGGQATIFQGTSVIKIRCPVKKFDKANIIWKKNDEELRKSRKYKINKKGALKIIEIDFSDSGIYSCWAGQMNAIIHLTVRPKSRNLMSTDEVLRSRNVHQTQGAHLISAPFNSEPLYSVSGENNRNNQHESKKSVNTTEKLRRKKHKKSQFSTESTKKYDYSVTPLYQPIRSTASSGSATLMPHLSHIFTTIKSYWPHRDTVSSNFKYANFISYAGINDQNKISTTEVFPLYNNNHQNLKKFHSAREEHDIFLNSNKDFPDNILGPQEERFFSNNNKSLETQDIILSNKNHDKSRQHIPTDITLNLDTPPAANGNYQSSTEVTFNKNEKDSYNEEKIHNKFYLIKKLNKNIQMNFMSLLSDTTNDELIDASSIQNQNSSISDSPTYVSLRNLTDFTNFWSDEKEISTISDVLINETSIEMISNKSMISNITITTTVNNKVTSIIEENEDDKNQQLDSKNINVHKEMEKTMKILDIQNKNITPFVLLSEDISYQPVFDSIKIFHSGKNNFKFEWITTDWSKCSQTCGDGGFQMRGAQCTVQFNETKGEINTTKLTHRTIIGASLCENANYPMPQKVRVCGIGKCPQWHSGPWTHCETSRCFDWKTAMQRREISCRLTEESENRIKNSTNIDPRKCDETIKPPQRQECYNDICKGVWRVSEWSECTASCEKDGIKYRILQCVWYGTKKPAGNVCGNIPRPPVMKTCRGPPCSKSLDCKDHSQLCERVKQLGMCHIFIYQKQCCKSCRQEQKI